MHAADHSFRAIAIFQRRSVFQVAGKTLELILLMTCHGKSPAVAILNAAETETAVEVGDVIDQFIQRITLVL